MLADELLGGGSQWSTVSSTALFGSFLILRLSLIFWSTSLLWLRIEFCVPVKKKFIYKTNNEWNYLVLQILTDYIIFGINKSPTTKYTFTSYLNPYERTIYLVIVRWWILTVYHTHTMNIPIRGISRECISSGICSKAVKIHHLTDLHNDLLIVKIAFR